MKKVLIIALIVTIPMIILGVSHLHATAISPGFQEADFGSVSEHPRPPTVNDSTSNAETDTPWNDCSMGLC